MTIMVSLKTVALRSDEYENVIGLTRSNDDKLLVRHSL